MKSLRERLPVLFVLMMLPVLVFTAFSFYYSGRQMRERVIDTNAAALEFYRQELDTSLTDLQNYLLNFSVFGADTAGLNSSDHDTRILTQVAVCNQLKQDLTLFDADCLFLYSPVYDSFVITYTGDLDYKEIVSMRKAISEDCDRYRTNYRWKLGKIGSNAYLYQINYSVYNGPCLYGALLDIDTVQKRLQAGQNDLSVYLTDESGNPLVGAETLRDQNITLH